MLCKKKGLTIWHLIKLLSTNDIAIKSYFTTEIERHDEIYQIFSTCKTFYNRFYSKECAILFRKNL